LRLLDDALRRIACVAAPCIRPADAGNAAHVGSETVSWWPTSFRPDSRRVLMAAPKPPAKPSALVDTRDIVALTVKEILDEQIAMKLA